MKAVDIRALPEGTELFFCRYNGWNTGTGTSGIRVTVVDATVGHWRFNEDTEQWERRKTSTKYGRFGTTYGILVSKHLVGTRGHVFVAATGHIRGLFDACQAELAALWEKNEQAAKRKQSARHRAADIRDTIYQEFGLEVGSAGMDSPNITVNAEHLLNLLQEMHHAAQQ